MAGPVTHAGQHLDGVEAAHGRAAPAELARHVHEAPKIAGEQQFGARLLDRRRLLLDDGVGDGRILDAERAAEAAAHVVALELPHLKTVHGGEQLARLAKHIELAQARASVVIGGRAAQAAPLGPIAADVDQELGDLVSLLAERHRRAPARRDRRRAPRGSAGGSSRRRSPMAPRHSRKARRARRPAGRGRRRAPCRRC